MKINKGFAVAAVALAVQIAAIGWLVWRYERIVLNGTEVRLKCQAYDPYDPLRGRYLSMTVREDCTNILFDASGQSEYDHRNDVFVQLAEIPGSNGLYRVEAVAKEPTNGGLWARPKWMRMEYLLGYNNRGKDESYDDFHARREKSGRKAVVSFPDQLFVNEKVAPEAEKRLHEQMSSAIAVYRVLDGEAVLTDIEIDGKPILSAVKKEQE